MMVMMMITTKPDRFTAARPVAIARLIRSSELRVVAIGGGTGLAAILPGLITLTSAKNITACVTPSDNGGSSGLLSAITGLPPPGDARRVFAAFAGNCKSAAAMLNFEFGARYPPEMRGHKIGNLVIAALAEINDGDITAGLSDLASLLGVEGKIYLAATQLMTLQGEKSDGTIISGEAELARAPGAIRRIWLSPATASATPQVIEAIDRADLVVLAPGSLYTSLIANLAVSEIAGALSKTLAIKVYICNLVEQEGETNGFTAGDHLAAIAAHCGGASALDYCIVQQPPIAANGIAADIGEISRHCTPILADVRAVERPHHHDPYLVAEQLRRIVG